MPISEQDLQVIFDPTGEAEISAADIKQVTDTAQPANERGINMYNIDAAVDTPTVPDAVTFTRYQRNWWHRVSHPDAGSPTIRSYRWNPYIPSDATFLKWQELAITIPSSLPPDGPAGGDLTGTYPEPIIGANKVTATKLASSVLNSAARAVTGDHIRDNTIPINRLQAGAIALQIFRVKADLTGFELVTKKVIEVAEPEVADAGKILRINSLGTGYEKVDASAVGATVVQTKAVSIIAQTCSSIIPFDATIPQASEGDSVCNVNITPSNATNLIRVRATFFATRGTDGVVIAALFKGGTDDALAAVACNVLESGNQPSVITIETIFLAGATTEINIALHVGVPSGTSYVNKGSGISYFGTAAPSYMFVEELVGTIS